jgi:RNA polymerase sigma factor (sigma-70 family)
MRTSTKGNLDQFGWWGDSIKGIKLLPHDEILKLFEQRKLGGAASKKATGEIVKHNLRLVASIARNWKNRGIEIEDLIQEGNMGLMHAVEKFDPSKGNKFSTYATWWIRQHISHHVGADAGTVRLPGHAYRLRNRILSAIKDYQVLHGGAQPDWDEVAAVVGSSADVAQAVWSATQVVKSLDAAARGSASSGSEKAYTLADVIPDPDGLKDDSMDWHSVAQSLRHHFTALDEADKNAIRMRAEGLSLRDVGEKAYGHSGTRAQMKLREVYKTIGRQLCRDLKIPMNLVSNNDVLNIVEEALIHVCD